MTPGFPSTEEIGNDVDIQVCCRRQAAAVAYLQDDGFVTDRKLTAGRDLRFDCAIRVHNVGDRYAEWHRNGRDG